MTTPNNPDPSDRLDTDVSGGGRKAGRPTNGGGPPGLGSNDGAPMSPSDPILTALAAIQQAVAKANRDIVAQLSMAGNLGGRTGARRASHAGAGVNPGQASAGDGFRDDQDGTPEPTSSGAHTDRSGIRYSTLAARAASRMGDRIGQGAAEGSMRAGLAGAIGESGGTMAGMRMGLRGVPVVGGIAMAAETAKSGYDKYLDQASRSRSVQEIEGGTGIHATGTRFSRWGNRFSYLNEDRRTADEQFNNALSLGYTDGGQRRALTDWQAHQTSARGMSTEQEAQTLSVAARNGQTNLESLTRSIYDVSKAANHAGVNAKLARDKFIDMFRLTTGSGMGQSANAVADALTSSVTSMGRQFDNASYAGALDTNFQYRLAANSGMSPGAYQAASRNDPTFAPRAITANARMGLDAALSSSQKQAIQDAINAAGGPAKVKDSPGLANGVVNDLTRNGSFMSGIDLNNLANVVTSQTGFSATPDTVLLYIVQFYAGQTPAAQAEALSLASKPVNVSGQAGSAVVSTRGGGISVGAGLPGKLPASANGFMDDKTLADRMKVKVRRDGWLDGYKDNAGLKNYEGNVNKTGNRDPIIEALIQSVPDPDKARVEVQTGGHNKIMSLSQAIRDFPDELAQGQVRFVDVKGSTDSQGNNLGGRTTADVAGSSDSSRDFTQEISDSTTGGKTANTGQDADAYAAKHGGKSSSSVTLTIAPPYDQIFRQMVGGNNAASAGAGIPPTNPTYANPTR